MEVTRMESNNKKPIWWIDPVSNVREKLKDISNKDSAEEFHNLQPTKPTEKCFFKSKVRSNKNVRRKDFS
jgi:hypothetical protein